ncbi:hypothetical protein JYB87_11965 [Shewanella avicenniae]|uniref:Phage shock protein B n=1 Tax=Shewanella avicenniae TaxID=2814294 RepID=A0ABX7QP42_9GAMM|nr:hypothetical protein [Shewanella avicenniae]QSX32481.1 hypothetical protein JYB87_11965 [Shewanella avicenniae]
MAAPEKQHNNEVITLLINFSIPILILGVTLLTGWVSRIDDRQYNISQNYASKEELKDAVEKLSMLIETRREQQEQSNRLILEEIRKTNRSVQELALTIERRTKSEK